MDSEGNRSDVTPFCPAVHMPRRLANVRAARDRATCVPHIIRPMVPV